MFTPQEVLDKEAFCAQVIACQEAMFRTAKAILRQDEDAEDAVQEFMALVRESFSHARFIVEPTTALCSYYAEAGGYIVGFEGAFNAHNDNSKF